MKRIIKVLCCRDWFIYSENKNYSNLFWKMFLFFVEVGNLTFLRRISTRQNFRAKRVSFVQKENSKTRKSSDKFWLGAWDKGKICFARIGGNPPWMANIAMYLLPFHRNDIIFLVRVRYSKTPHKRTAYVWLQAELVLMHYSPGSVVLLVACENYFSIMRVFTDC